MMNSSEVMSSSFKVLPEVMISAKKDGKKYQNWNLQIQVLSNLYRNIVIICKYEKSLR